MPNSTVPRREFTLGQSGDRVFIVDDSGKAAVRKEAGSTQSHARLSSQFKKHAMASAGNDMEPIAVPKILEDMNDTGYTMEYVHGVPIGQLLSNGSRGQLLLIADVVGDYFERYALQGQNSHLREQVGSKISALVEVYSSMSDQVSKNVGLRALDQFAEYFDSADLRAAWNHGDFSLENLLFQPETSKVFSIDFLDSPFDTILLDAGRIWLDIGKGWWGDGVRPVATSQANLFELRTRLSGRLEKIGVSNRDLVAFSTLAALRILPYTKNPVRKAFLKASLIRFQGEK